MKEIVIVTEIDKLNTIEKSSLTFNENIKLILLYDLFLLRLELSNRQTSVGDQILSMARLSFASFLQLHSLKTSSKTPTFSSYSRRTITPL